MFRRAAWPNNIRDALFKKVVKYSQLEASGWAESELCSLHGPQLVDSPKPEAVIGSFHKNDTFADVKNGGGP